MNLEQRFLEHLKAIADRLKTCKAVKGEGFADTVKMMVTLSLCMGYAASHRIELAQQMAQDITLRWAEKHGLDASDYPELAKMANALGHQLEATVRDCASDNAD
jgi:hypothetical protein